MDGLRRTLCSCSDDKTIRVWDIDTMRQLYDFATPDDHPSVVTCHPLLEVSLYVLNLSWLKDSNVICSISDSSCLLSSTQVQRILTNCLLSNSTQQVNLIFTLFHHTEKQVVGAVNVLFGLIRLGIEPGFIS